VKLKDRDVWPKDGSDHIGYYNLSSGTLRMTGRFAESLPKDNSRPPKGLNHQRAGRRGKSEWSRGWNILNNYHQVRKQFKESNKYNLLWG